MRHDDPDLKPGLLVKFDMDNPDLKVWLNDPKNPKTKFKDEVGEIVEVTDKGFWVKIWWPAFNEWHDTTQSKWFVKYNKMKELTPNDFKVGLLVQVRNDSVPAKYALNGGKVDWLCQLDQVGEVLPYKQFSI